MKKFLFPVIAFALVSCGGGESQSTEATVEEAPKNCTYSLTAEKAEVYWEAYKLSEKVGVGGQFDSLSFVSDKESGSLSELLQGQSISIYTESINSKDPVRDGKIQEFFFKKMINTAVITGEIVRVEGDDTEGTAVANLTLNGVSGETNLAYTLKEGELKLSGEVNVNNWQGGEVLASLNEVCKEKHTSPDGKSVLWPDVKVDFFVPVNVACE